MPNYTCDLCNKTFKQKVDFQRHKNKKAPCVSIEEIQRRTSNTNEKNVLINAFKNCLNILRDNEGLTGEKALRNLSQMLILKLIEPHLDGEIDIMSYEFDFSHIDESDDYIESYKEKMMSIVYFSNLVNEKEIDISNNIKHLWDDILSKHPSTSKIFLENKGFDMQHNSTYKRIIDKLNSDNFTESSYDILGNAYEEVVQDIMTGKVLGQFFTQPLIKHMMVELIDPQIDDEGYIESVCDPTMGTGGFLISYLQDIMKKAKSRNIEIDWEYVKNEVIYGKEIEPDTFQLAMSNMLISAGHMFDSLEKGDSIRQPITRKFDNILANPPFGIKGLKYDEFNSSIKNEYVPIKSDNAVSLFIQAIIYMLKINGKCAVVLPDGQDIFNKTNKTLITIREYLLKTCDLKEVIYLPSGIFTYTSVKTCIFFFTKKKEGTQVLTVDIKTNSTGKETKRNYKFSKTHQTKNVKFYETLMIKENSQDKLEKSLLIEVPISKIAKNAYSLNYNEYVEKVENVDIDTSVQLMSLGDMFECKMGKFNSNDMDNNGTIPFYSCSSSNPVGLHSTYSFDNDEYLLIICAGGSQNNIIGENVGLGKCYYVTGKTACRANVCSLVCKYANVNIKYVYNYLQINRIKICEQAHFTTNLGTISMNDIKSIQIPIPSIECQQMIVDQMDFLLETCNNSINQRIDILGKANEMCIKWEMENKKNKTTSLSDICDFIKTGKNKPSDNKTGTLYPYYGTGSITGYTDEYLFDGDYILTARNGTIGNCILTHGKIFPSDHMFVISIKNKLIRKYVYYFLSDNDELIKSKTGVGIPNITKITLESLQITIPSDIKLQKIIEYCENNDQQIKQLKEEIEQNKKLAKEYLNSIINQESEQEDTDNKHVWYELVLDGVDYYLIGDKVYTIKDDDKDELYGYYRNDEFIPL